MRTLLCTLACLCLASTAVAQMPTAGPPASPCPVTAPTSYLQAPVQYSNALPPATQTVSPVAQGPAQPLMVHTFGTTSPGTVNCGVPTSSCPPASCQPCPTCVREPAIKKITHTTYCSSCELFCVPSCGHCLLSLFGGCNDCGEPRERYYLIKKVHTEICPTTKCVPAICAPGGSPCPPR
jgi:hypothetical protein